MSGLDSPGFMQGISLRKVACFLTCPICLGTGVVIGCGCGPNVTHVSSCGVVKEYPCLDCEQGVVIDEELREAVARSLYEWDMRSGSHRDVDWSQAEFKNTYYRLAVEALSATVTYLKENGD